jgi:hypothetical protein
MSERVASLVEDIKSKMKGVEEWTRKKTSIPGIFLIRMPGKGLRVMLMFSPIDEVGNPRKRRGLFFSDAETLRQARRSFPDERLDALIAAVQQVNGPATGDTNAAEDVLEV